MARIRSRWLVGIAAATVAFGVGSAAAASLGLTVDTLSADQQAVLSCDTDGIGASFTTVYSATSQSYIVDNVNLTGINAACNTQDFKVTLDGAAPVSVTTAAASLSGTGNARTLASSFATQAVNASAVTRIAVSVTKP